MNRTEPSQENVVPARCVHFGVCGGCQYQTTAYEEQLALKRDLLEKTMRAAGVLQLPPVQTHASEPYEYRNRIRLRIERVRGDLRFGYTQQGGNVFVPIVMCPIAAPILWQTAESVLALAAEFWLDAADEVELFCDGEQQRVQMTLLCRRKVDAPAGSFARTLEALRAACPWLMGAGVVAVDPKSGRVLRTLDHWGADGLAYRVADETYWISRGGFFQVNRFLVPKLVELVCAGQSGKAAWDLFAGVGLFSRVLAQHFAQVTAVESNPIAVADLRNAMTKLGRSTAPWKPPRSTSCARPLSTASARSSLCSTHPAPAQDPKSVGCSHACSPAK